MAARRHCMFNRNSMRNVSIIPQLRLRSQLGKSFRLDYPNREESASRFQLSHYTIKGKNGVVSQLQFNDNGTLLYTKTDRGVFVYDTRIEKRSPVVKILDYDWTMEKFMLTDDPWSFYTAHMDDMTSCVEMWDLRESRRKWTIELSSEKNISWTSPVYSAREDAFFTKHRYSQFLVHACSRYKNSNHAAESIPLRSYAIGLNNCLISKDCKTMIFSTIFNCYFIIKDLCLSTLESDMRYTGSLPIECPAPNTAQRGAYYMRSFSRSDYQRGAVPYYERNRPQFLELTPLNDEHHANRKFEDACHISPNGRYLITLFETNDPELFTVTDLTDVYPTGTEEYVYTNRHKEGHCSIAPVMFPARTVAVASSKLPSRGITAAISSDSSVFSVAFDNYLINVYVLNDSDVYYSEEREAVSLKPVKKIKSVNNTNINCMAMSPDLKYLVTNARARSSLIWYSSELR